VTFTSPPLVRENRLNWLTHHATRCVNGARYRNVERSVSLSLDGDIVIRGVTDVARNICQAESREKKIDDRPALSGQHERMATENHRFFLVFGHFIADQIIYGCWYATKRPRTRTFCARRSWWACSRMWEEMRVRWFSTRFLQEDYNNAENYEIKRHCLHARFYCMFLYSLFSDKRSRLIFVLHLCSMNSMW